MEIFLGIVIIVTLIAAATGGNPSGKVIFGVSAVILCVILMLNA